MTPATGTSNGCWLTSRPIIRADILETTFDNASFDAVVSLYVLTHIPTDALPELLQRISSWLRPHGVFLATLGSAGEHDGFEGSWLGVPMYFSGLDPTTNEALVEVAGMRVVESRIESMQEPEGQASFHWVMARKTD